MTPDQCVKIAETMCDESRGRRPVFSVTAWGAPGVVGVIIGIAAILTGTPGTGLVMVCVGGAMARYAYRLYRRGTRW